MSEEANQAAAAAQGAPVETPSGATGGAPAGEAVNAVGGEIAVGNQKFKDVQALQAAYAELQKGHTQANQRHAEEMKAYEWLRGKLGEMRQNPQAWQTFTQLLRGGMPPAQAAQAANAQAQQQPQQAPDTGRADLHYNNQLNLMNARIELMEFQRAHPDVSEDDIDELVDEVVELSNQGKHYSLEDRYKLKFYEKNAATVFQKGQETAKAAQKAGANAQALGSTAPTAQVQAPKEDSYGDMKTEQEKYDWVVRNMRKQNIKP